MEFSRQEYCHFLLQGIFPPKDWTWVSRIADRCFTIWAPRAALKVAWGLAFPQGSQSKTDLDCHPLPSRDPVLALGGSITKWTVTSSLNQENKQVSACETECILSWAVQYLTWSKAPFPVYIHFILWPCKSNSVVLTAVGKINNNIIEQATTKSNPPFKKKKNRKKIWRQIPQSPWQALAMSKVRIIDFDIEESSNWNETCLNNSLNVSFLAFQITRAVKPDFFLLAGSQRTFCVQGACERMKRKSVNLPLSGWLLGLDSRPT